jgi:hypothetical protein
MGVWLVGHLVRFAPAGSDLGRHGFFTFDNTADWGDEIAEHHNKANRNRKKGK